MSRKRCGICETKLIVVFQGNKQIEVCPNRNRKDHLRKKEDDDLAHRVREAAGKEERQ